MFGIIIGLAVVGFVGFGVMRGVGQASGVDGVQMTVHKTPTCGCCANYIDYLRRRGADVTVEDHSDLAEIKNQFGITRDEMSCHTTVVGGYFVEGHVPVEVIASLLKDKPAIRGISLPGMPSGSPGMPGAKRGPFYFDQLGNDGAWSDYTTM